MSNIKKQKISAYTLIVVSVVSFLIMVMASNGLLTEPAYDSTYRSTYEVAFTAISAFIIYVFPAALLFYAISSYTSASATKRGMPRGLRIFVLIVSCLIALIPIMHSVASLIPYEPEPERYFGPEYAAWIIAFASAWVTIPLAFIVALTDIMMTKRT